jgi:D-serine dehydratase
MAKHLSQGTKPLPGHLWIKADHDLPVAGSIKARGGIYEVLHFAEALALENGLLKSTDDDYRQLADEKARALFQQYTLSVGSTGNLGLSIGLISAALGFQACVHMSVEAKQWKKDRLRNNGVTVVEHSNDYSNAVAAGRIAAEQDDYAYFVDDENSEHLFLGYSVAALRLKKQLQEKNITVDAEHPLFVYIPCGVGGAPGGITFGLKQVFSEAVHCFFAEPTQAPCMLLGMATEFKDDLTVYDAGLAINTEADGLAVGQASQLVGEIMKPLLSGIFTVEDDQLFRDLYQLKESEGLKIEPSAAAGFSGPRQLCQTDEGLDYINQHDLAGKMDQSIHLVWTTGGCFVPEDEYQGFYQRGKSL